MFKKIKVVPCVDGVEIQLTHLYDKESYYANNHRKYRYCIGTFCKTVMVSDADPGCVFRIRIPDP
jgi:hypothetical protein